MSVNGSPKKETSCLDFLHLLRILFLPTEDCIYLFCQSGSGPAPPSISDSNLSHFLCVFGHCSGSSLLMAIKETQQIKQCLGSSFSC